MTTRDLDAENARLRARVLELEKWTAADAVEAMRAKCEAIARDLDHFEIGKQIANAIAALPLPSASERSPATEKWVSEFISEVMP